MVATGDDFGKVKIFRYPSLRKGSESKIGSGHSSHVTCVRFNITDEFLISTGGEDNCVIQWSIVKN